MSRQYSGSPLISLRPLLTATLATRDLPKRLMDWRKVELIDVPDCVLVSWTTFPVTFSSVEGAFSLCREILDIV